MLSEKTTIKIFSDIAELNFSAAESFVSTGKTAIEERGKFTVALAGGSTPKSLYRLLTTDIFKNRIDWTKTFFFFGDERNVLSGDAESNFRMASENLLKPLQTTENRIFRWQTELKDAKKVAADYEQTIKKFFDLGKKEFPHFDLILLGMGGDGHTASLLPHTKALREKTRNAVVNPVEKLDTTRLTLTFPVINNARNVIFLVAGAGKAETLQKVLDGGREPEKYPAQAVELKGGELLWLVDEAAAALLDR